MSTKNTTATSYVVNSYLIKTSIVKCLRRICCCCCCWFSFSRKNVFIKQKNNHTSFNKYGISLPRTYNITSSTTFVTFLFFVQTCLQFTAFTLLTTPKLRLHYSQYNVNTTSTIHLVIKLF